MLKKADVIVYLILGSVLGFTSYTYYWQPGEHADLLKIQSGNDKMLVAALSIDQTISVDGPLGDSVIEIKEGKARFITSPCHGKYCVRNGWLSRSGEFNACLPNRISLSIISDDPRFDTINF